MWLRIGYLELRNFRAPFWGLNKILYLRDAGGATVKGNVLQQPSPLIEKEWSHVQVFGRSLYKTARLNWRYARPEIWRILLYYYEQSTSTPSRDSCVDKSYTQRASTIKRFNVFQVATQAHSVYADDIVITLIDYLSRYA